jgi:hypothetical protein
VLSPAPVNGPPEADEVVLPCRAWLRKLVQAWDRWRRPAGVTAGQDAAANRHARSECTGDLPESSKGAVLQQHKVTWLLCYERVTRKQHEQHRTTRCYVR